MKEVIVLITDDGESREIIVFMSRKRAVREFKHSKVLSKEMSVALLDENME